LYTDNKTVEACAEWVSAFYSHLAKKPSKHNIGSAWFRHLTLTSGLLDPKPQPVQNRKERGWPKARLFISHTKKWSYWRVESAPTRAHVVSREWPHLTRVCQTHDSIPVKVPNHSMRQLQPYFCIRQGQ